MFKFQRTQNVDPIDLKKDIKVALDTNLLVDCIMYPLVLQHIFRKFNIIRKGKVITSEICIAETKKTLINKFNISALETNKKVEDLIKSLNISIIKITENTFRIGEELLTKHRQLHKPDNFILANFIENEASHLMTIDYDFSKVAEKENIRSIKIPNANTVQDIEFKNALKF